MVGNLRFCLCRLLGHLSLCPSRPWISLVSPLSSKDLALTTHSVTTIVALKMATQVVLVCRPDQQQRFFNM